MTTLSLRAAPSATGRCRGTAALPTRNNKRPARSPFANIVYTPPSRHLQPASNIDAPDSQQIVRRVTYETQRREHKAKRTTVFQKHFDEATPTKNSHSNKPPLEVAAAGFVPIEFDGTSSPFSSGLLRDLCKCPRCVDSSTQQRHFCTADIPTNIKGTVSPSGADKISISWTNDIPGYDGHVTELSLSELRSLNSYGAVTTPPALPKRVFWQADQYAHLSDIDFEDYMRNDQTLLKALWQLHTHGLLFLVNVPDNPESVSTAAERIGPLKTTFYGPTWDVRSVPDAKNVAYTSQNLGFHMDLMYMVQPPHLQLLHCIRSSSAGGASLFTDSFRAASDLSNDDLAAFQTLATKRVPFHYDHPGSQYYRQSRSVIEQRWVHAGKFQVRGYPQAVSQPSLQSAQLKLEDFLEAVSWAPPFQAPFSLHDNRLGGGAGNAAGVVSAYFDDWHRAAKHFTRLIEQTEGIYERLMRPGECVIFDNRRVLHARKAFEVLDAGKERWLRGAYIDKDPYLSKMRVLTDQLGMMAP